jgi:hypothetical protein
MGRPITPTGYRKLKDIDWKRDLKRFQLWSLLSMIPVMYSLLYGIPGLNEKLKTLTAGMPELLAALWIWVVVMAGGILLIVLHESVHYLVALACGYKPTMIIQPLKQLFAVAMFQQWTTRNKGIAIAVAPFLLLTPVLIFMAWYSSGVLALMFLSMAALNITGSSQDLYMTWWMSRQHPAILSYLTMDMKEYFFVPKDEKPKQESSASR